MRLLLCLGLALLAAVVAAADCPAVEAGSPGDRRPQARKDAGLLRVAHFNAEWLFRDGVSTKSPWGSDHAAHTRGVARLLDSLDADLIHLAEVYDCQVLDELLAEMPRTGPALRRYLVQGTDTGCATRRASRPDRVRI